LTLFATGGELHLTLETSAREVNAAMLGWLRKNEVPALDRNGYRSTKVSSKAKSRR